MKRLIPFIAALFLAAAPPSVHFSPHGGCTAALVAAIDGAKSSVRMQAYSFTSPEIGDALLRAHKRGVNVAVVVDRGQPRLAYSQCHRLADSRIHIAVDSAHPIAHSKVVVVDAARVCTGSFNYSRQAESNLENLVILDDAPLAAAYLANWTQHRQHSVALLPAKVR